MEVEWHFQFDWTFHPIQVHLYVHTYIHVGLGQKATYIHSTYM